MIREEAYPTRQAAWQATCALLGGARAEGRRGVLLVRDLAATVRAKHELAQAGAGFGVTVATPAQWAGALWELFGDGRALVAPAQRAVLLDKLAREALGEKATAGMVDLLSKTAREALCWLEPACDAPLEGDERTVAEVLHAYRGALAEAGMLEACEAQAALAREEARGVLAPYAPVLFDAQDVRRPAALERFLETAGAVAVHGTCGAAEPVECEAELRAVAGSLFRRQAGEAAVTARGRVRLALSSGPTAEAEALLESACALLDEGARDVTVAVPDARAWRRFAQDALLARGVRVVSHESAPFERTDLGRALLALAQLTGPQADADVLLAADFAVNPFAGMWYGTAFFADKTHRADRLIEPGEVLTDLAGHAAPELQGVIGLLEAGEAEAAFDVLAAWCNAKFARDEAYRAEQLAVLAAARAGVEAGRRWGVGWADALRAVGGGRVSAQAETRACGPGDGRGAGGAGAAGAPAADAAAGAEPDAAAPASRPSPGPQAAEAAPVVRITSLAGAAQLPAASTDALVVGGLGAAAYPVRAASGAFETLLAKLGALPPEDPLGAMRRTFLRALAAARSTLVLERALHDEAAEPAQPAIAFDAVLDCYRPAPGDTSADDDAVHVPAPLLPHTARFGEQRLQLNATGRPAPPAARLPRPHAGSISPHLAPLIVLPRTYQHQAAFPGMDLSASQIESFVECPYQWFAKRRLRLETLEEGFGPVERGTFLHAVLEAFHTRFSAEAAPKVTPQTLPAARALMADVFNAQAARQTTELRPGDRYAPADAWEEHLLHSLLPRLLDGYLPLEARLLPGFQPWKAEWAYGGAEPVRYAGCNICGRIDRIDIDAQGRAVVIDYKSSLSASYRLHAKDDPAAAGLPPDPALPAKIQALIYAKVVREQLGVRVVGTLYVNPIARAGRSCVLGAYDARELGPADIPFATAADAACCAVPWGPWPDFDALIDGCEQLVAGRMAALAAGDVAPDPSGEAACEWCPVGNCPARLVERTV